MSKKITQLSLQPSAKEVLSRDMLLFAGRDRINPGLANNVYQNYKVSAESFVTYVNSNIAFPIKLNDQFLQSPGVESVVSNQEYNVCDIDSLTFNNFGVVTDLTSSTKTKRSFTGACGTINPISVNNKWKGYFDKSVVGTRNPGPRRAGSAPTWVDFFDTSYSEYKKTIVNYVAKAATNNYQTCTHKVIIYWGTTENAVVSGCGQYPSSKINTLIQDDGWVTQENVVSRNYIVGMFPISQEVWTSTSAAATAAGGQRVDGDEILSSDLPVMLEIDNVNKKIVKLPITNYNVSTTEKIYISMTVESFA